MDIVGAITNFLSGGVVGGITGVIGSISSHYLNLKMKELEYKQQREMLKLQIKAKQAGIEGDIKVAELQAWKESYSTEKQSFSPSYFDALPNWFKPIVAFLFSIVDFMRGITRPALTFYITFLVSYLWYKTYQTNPNSFVTSATLMVETILFVFATIVSWWFASREITKFIENKLK